MSFGLNVSSTPMKSAQVHCLTGFFVSAAAPAGIAIAIRRTSWPSFIGCAPLRGMSNADFYHQRTKLSAYRYSGQRPRSVSTFSLTRGRVFGEDQLAKAFDFSGSGR